MTTKERIAAALEAHRIILGVRAASCSCEDWKLFDRDEPDLRAGHRAHLADVLAEVCEGDMQDIRKKVEGMVVAAETFGYKQGVKTIKLILTLFPSPPSAPESEG